MNLKGPQKLFNQLRSLEPGKTKKEKKQMDNEVKPTWKLAWGLWWRMFLISLGISVIIGAILFAVGVTFMWDLMPWCVP